MTGQFYLDGIDAYTSLGICVTKGSYNNLVAFPAIKELEKDGTLAKLSKKYFGEDVFSYVDKEK